MHGYNRAVISCERNAKYLQKTMKTNESYLPLKRPSAGPFFKSILAEIYFTIYKSWPVYLDEPFGVLYSDAFHAKNLNNVPCGTVVRVYWQGCNVHVEMADGGHFVYEDFGGYSSRWKA